MQKSEYYKRYSEFYDFISDPTIAVITCGCLIIVVSMFGMIGALRDNIKLLYVVSVFIFEKSPYTGGLPAMLGE